MFYISHLLFQITGLQEDVIESQKSATPDDFGHLATEMAKLLNTKSIYS